MIRSILVAVDNSPRAPHVAEVATDLATHYGARLVLMRAITLPADFPPAAHVYRADGLEQYLHTEAHREVETLGAKLAGALVDSVVVAVGEAWRAILDVAERRDVDLIVIGSHGYGGLDHLLGTTAAKVVNHARRNVFVVHAAPSR